MLERRSAQRRRVCLEAQLLSGLWAAETIVRVRNMTDQGAELVAPDGEIEVLPLRVRIGDDELRDAIVIWRKADRLGVKFFSDGAIVPRQNEDAWAARSQRGDVKALAQHLDAIASRARRQT